MLTRIKINEIEEKYEALAEKYSLHVKDIEMIFIESLVMFFGSEDIDISSEGVLVSHLIHEHIEVYSNGQKIGTKSPYEAKVIRESVPLNSQNHYNVKVASEEIFLPKKRYENVKAVGDSNAAPRYKKKYYNIRTEQFSKVLAYFNKECNRRGSKKIEAYVDAILAENNYIVYGKVIERSDYHYVIQPMLSKRQPIRYMAPIHIDRVDGARIPENIRLLPIEIIKNSKKRNNDTNLLHYKASFFSTKLAEVHLINQMNRLKDNYKVHTMLKVAHYDNGILTIKDCSDKKELHFKIIGYFLNYFKRFQVKAIIKTKIIRR